MTRIRPKLGLALGSGSARGWAHVGVLRELEARGLKPDIVTGASVGALVAGAYASGQLDALEVWIRTLTKVDVWRLVDTTFRGGGVMTGNRLMQAIGEHVEDRRIEDLPIPFAAVAADLDTGQEVWLREGSMLNAVRASSGLPGLFSPMWYGDRWLIDGGVVNPVPVALCRLLGADYVIAVNLNRPPGKVAALMRRARLTGEQGRQENDEASSPHQDSQEAQEPENAADASASSERWALMQRWSGLVDGLAESLRSSKRPEPGLFEVMSAAVNIMQDRITRSRIVGDPPSVLLNPNLAHFQLMDFHRADEAIVIGRTVVQRAAVELEELREIMAL